MTDSNIICNIFLPLRKSCKEMGHNTIEYKTDFNRTKFFENGYECYEEILTTGTLYIYETA